MARARAEWQVCASSRWFYVHLPTHVNWHSGLGGHLTLNPQPTQVRHGMRHSCIVRSRTAITHCMIVAAGMAACSDDDSPNQAQGTVMGVFRDEAGAAIANAPVSIFVSDTANETSIENRTLTTDAAGRFSTTFSFDIATMPVLVSLYARPALGSGLADVQVFDPDSILALAPGRAADTLRYELTTLRLEPPVNDDVAAPLSQGSLLGRYEGESVAPFGGYVIVTLELDITSTTGSVTGQFHAYYNATTSGNQGTILGAVILDTLRLQLTTETGPVETSSFKAFTPSAGADTLIVLPDPCAEHCMFTASPLRLVRTP